MKTRAFILLAGVLGVAACVSPTPPEQVGTHNGKPVYQIYTSMQALDNPTSAELAEASKMLQGSGRGNLAERASAQCPAGYDIVGKTEPASRFIMVLANGVKQYKIEQVFRITCR